MGTTMPIFSNIPNTQNMTETEYDAAWNQTLSEFNPWSIAANAIASEIEINAANAEAAAGALASAKWVAGQFTEGNVRWSPTDHLNYRARNTGILTIDPAFDPANWALLTKTSNGGADQKSSGVNITLTATDGRVQSIAMTAAYKYVKLPAPGALNEGLVFIITNTGEYTFRVKNNSGDVVARVDPGAVVGFNLVDISTGAWLVIDMGAQHSARSPVSLLTEMINTAVSNSFAVTRLSDVKFLAIYFATDVTAVVLDESNAVLTAGTPAAITDSSVATANDVVALSSTLAVAVYRKGTALDVAALTISASTVTVGTGANIDASGSSPGAALAMLTATRAIVFYEASGGVARVLDVSGSTVTPGAQSAASGNLTADVASIAAITSDKAVAAGVSGTILYVTILDISGTTVTPGTLFQETLSGAIQWTQTIALNTTKIAVIVSTVDGIMCYLLSVSDSSLTKLADIPLHVGQSSNGIARLLPDNKIVLLFTENFVSLGRQKSLVIKVENNDVYVLAKSDLRHESGVSGGLGLALSSTGKKGVVARKGPSGYASAHVVEVPL